ncbi:B12-binding domain-containing radical SAM protein [Geothrix sp. 21YS21S-2]|uniref:B12-binding domain-containing radical SAM protein n=1 Tax=Geothrix sp. 21YS21S-2 TaxID=3068893 RepID=UPI0027B93815|nr:B12-binding domain-containing radical SAM protein [Geothrix sp. 21YS21S-2]
MSIKALLVYPEMPPTYWSMCYALPFLGRKATLPPLGLLTVAALLPRDWVLTVLDLNVEPLAPGALARADLVLASAMLVQKASFERLIALCREAGTPVVAGGPYPTSCWEQIEGVTTFVLGEAEVNLPPFLADFGKGVARHRYDDSGHPDLAATPAPRYDLVDSRRYAGAALQYSRGCPHDCEFCDIVSLFGHRPRTKTPAQFLRELDVLVENGWSGSLFIVDDNFIGNRAEVRRLLPALSDWQEKRGRPFEFFTEASLDLAADEPLLEGMAEAGFNMVFVGIETPDAATLKAVHKHQNVRADLLESVRTIQGKGLEVAGGFIVGFDEDREDIFDRQTAFIQEAGIPTAMVGLLTALPKTRLHARLAAEGRLLGASSGGNNTHDLDLNFVPRMDAARLREGYKRILRDLYTPSHYFARCLELLRRMRPAKVLCRRVGGMEVRALIHSLVRQTFSHYGLAYVSFLARALAIRPRMIAEIIAMAVKGHHFITITDGLLALERLRDRLDLDPPPEAKPILRAPAG